MGPLYGTPHQVPWRGGAAALRRSRGATLEGQDEVDAFLGIDGEAFKMEHAPCPVEFLPVSVKSGEIGDVTSWIHSTFS